MLTLSKSKERLQTLTSNSLTLQAKCTHGWKSEERNSEDAEAGRDDFPHPRPGHRIPVADCSYGDDAPPEGVRVAREIPRVLAVRPHRVLFRKVYEVAAEYQAEEAYVQGGY